MNLKIAFIIIWAAIVIAANAASTADWNYTIEVAKMAALQLKERDAVSEAQLSLILREAREGHDRARQEGHRIYEAAHGGKLMASRIYELADSFEIVWEGIGKRLWSLRHPGQ